jgi:hypothetical protein
MSMVQVPSVRSLAIASLLSLVVSFAVSCTRSAGREVATTRPASEPTVTIAPGELYFVLPRRVCTSIKHVGDTVTAAVWRAQRSERIGMIGFEPDPMVPDSLQATMRVIHVDVDSSDVEAPIQFAVERFALGALRGVAPTRNPSPDPATAARASTRGFVNMERCFERGRSLAGGLTDSLVLR